MHKKIIPTLVIITFLFSNAGYALRVPLAGDRDMREGLEEFRKPGLIASIPLDRIIAISAVNVIDYEGLFKQQLEKLATESPDIEVVTIADSIEEYKDLAKGLKEFGIFDFPHLHIMVAKRRGIENTPDLQGYQILEFGSREKEISFFEELDLYARGINLGVRHKLDRKAVRAMVSGV